MNQTAILLLAASSVLLASCCSNSCDIRDEEYIRNSPEETFELFARAAECDDPFAAFACLSSATKERYDEMEFVEAWDVAGGRLRSMQYVTLEQVRNEPRSRIQPARKITLVHGDHTFHFLMILEEGLWLFTYPTPYHSEEELLEILETIEEEAG